MELREPKAGTEYRFLCLHGGSMFQHLSGTLVSDLRIENHGEAGPIYHFTCDDMQGHTADGSVLFENTLAAAVAAEQIASNCEQIDRLRKANEELLATHTLHVKRRLWREAETFSKP